MAVSDIDAVLEFLRKNGLSESESALMEDVLEKSELGSVDFQRFLFPMVPPPPTLKIPATRVPRRQSVVEVQASPAVDCFSDSSDDFVSLGSSTTDVCSSEFTNPYGIRATTGASSQSSSDHLSQFGTARDYPDFDMQNDLCWYEEKDEEDYSMPPIFGTSDSFGGPSEDKFVTTTENQIQDESAFNHISQGFQSIEETNYLDKPWPFTSIDAVKDEVHVTNYYLKGGVDLAVNSLTNFETTETDDSHNRVKEDKRNSIYDSVGLNTKVVEKDRDNTVANEDDIITNDELLTYMTNEDEYEVFNLRIIHRKNRTGFEENKEMPIVINSMIAGRYYVTEYLGSAAFSKVVQAHDLYMETDVCLKIIKNDKDFFDQSLDEIKLLKFVNKHDPGDERHILRLYDYFYFQEHLFIVCELLRANLYEFQKYNRESGGEPYFTLNRLQIITRQCLEALEYLHELGIIHCDLKPENILIKSYRRCEIKVIDLGSSCFQTDNLCLYVQSRSYRAPEVILGLQYDEKIDIWSLGCILAELCSGEVLFPNDGIVMSLARMVGFLGPIDTEMLVKGQETHKYFTKEFDLYHINEETNELEYIIPAESSLEEQLQELADIGFTDFVRDLLEINPQRRPTAREALSHPWLSHSYI